jgi:hypothetical protein
VVRALLWAGVLAILAGALYANQPHPTPPRPVGHVIRVNGGPLLVARVTYTDGHIVTLGDGDSAPSDGVVTVIAVATASTAPAACVITVNWVDVSARSAPAGQVARCQWAPG